MVSEKDEFNHILLVNSCGYYKFQVEIFILKLCISINLWFSTLNYTVTIQGWWLSEAQLLTGEIG